MLRLLILILILLYLIYVFDRLIGRLLRRGRRTRTDEPVSVATPRADPSPLIACPACGIHFVADRGHRADGGRYCSKACHSAVTRAAGPPAAIDRTASDRSERGGPRSAAGGD